MGPPGTGKSHLAIALGAEAVKAGEASTSAPLADLLSQLAHAERERRPERIRFFTRAALLIVDEIGYLPVIPGGGNLVFQLVNARYERGAMILTSNRGFAEWGEVFGDPIVATALLDRLLHRAIVVQIEGSSYRLRQHAELCPSMSAPRPSSHHRARTNATSPWPSTKKWCHVPWALTGGTGDFYFGAFEENSGGIDGGAVRVKFHRRRVVRTASQQCAPTAAESWENAIKSEAQDCLENARFNCADRHQASVQQAFNGVTVTHVFVGYGEDEVEDMIQKS
ncbi:ATP-binding protein [Acidisphaera sp. S103]|uniref:ATP-binding protein n=1 Tax=Acidisphaera sp. S103 TaxID=1747223 RepID=UPI002739DA7F|nr:ATP-binding protein [Acidisphaera sp. S103]